MHMLRCVLSLGHAGISESVDLTKARLFFQTGNIHKSRSRYFLTCDLQFKVKVRFD